MIRIIHDQKEISCYKRIAELKRSQVKELVLDDDLFDTAGRMFQQGSDLLKVIANFKEEIYFANVQDRIIDCAGNSIEVNINADRQVLTENENIDLSLLERFDVFVFEELEEYTYKIARLLINKYQCKVIYFMDCNAEYFFDRNDITIISSLADIATQNEKKIMYITSSKQIKLKVADLTCYTYTSLQVMNSLCWACKVSHPGNKEGTVMLINTHFNEGCGFGFIIRAVSVLKTLAQERGWQAVVRITENMYTDNMNKNMWSQYFEQDEEHGRRMLAECENVIDLAKNHFTQLAIYYNPYFMEVWQDTEKHVRPQLRIAIRKEFETRLFRPIKNQDIRVLGALIRGTDASKEASKIASIDYMIERCREEMKEGNFDYIFLATEDKNIFDCFKKAFQEQLLYVNQKRVCMDPENEKVIGKLLDIQLGEKEQFGKEYLYITYCLSKCNALLYNMISGGYYLTKLWLNGKYEMEKQLKYSLPEIEKLCVICEMLQQGKNCVIYGTGNICSKLLNFLGSLGMGASIELCDAKAEVTNYKYHEKNVMSPGELIEKYKDGKIFCIIIASLIYADEINKYLVDSGVHMQNIIIFRDNEGIL